MNSTPAFSKARRTAASLAAVIDVCSSASSARRIVATTARVRISVQADGITIIREGHGTGEGRGASPGEVHDTALKAAETDATKRALATFGKPFGLALYQSKATPEPN